MAEDTDIELDDEAASEEEDEAPVEVAKTNLTKRRIIDNLLEERRLKRQISDYDFDF